MMWYYLRFCAADDFYSSCCAVETVLKKTNWKSVPAFDSPLFFHLVCDTRFPALADLMPATLQRTVASAPVLIASR